MEESIPSHSSFCIWKSLSQRCSWERVIGEAFAELLNCGKVQEILRQDTEDEEQAITGVGDDEVREDGMSMAAGTDEAEDAEAVSDGGAADEVNEGAVIAGMDPAGAVCPTAGTGLELWAESRHKRVKQGFG